MPSPVSPYIMKRLLPLAVALNMVQPALASDVDIVERAIDSSESPFVDGVFNLPARPIVAIPSRNPYATDWPTPFFDREGNSNELIIAFSYTNPGYVINVARLKSGSRADLEESVVAAVEQGDAVSRVSLGGAKRARHLMGSQRLPPEDRAMYDSDHPREKLEQYVILGYATVQEALSAKKQLEQNPAVSQVTVRRKMHLAWSPNDPYFPIQYTARTAGRYQWGIHAMNFPSAWDVTKGHGYVAAVDTGLFNGSPQADFAANYRRHFSLDTGAQPVDWVTSFHGAHVLGIIGAVANNGMGVAGGCPTCSLSMIQYDGIVRFSSTAFSKAIETGMPVINFSSTAYRPSPFHTILGEFNCSDPDYVDDCAAISFAKRRDVLIVAAAGNFARSGPGFPANQADVLSVAGLQNNSVGTPSATSRWVAAVFTSPQEQSDYGATYYASHYAGQSGVTAPAAAVVSTVPPGAEYHAPLNCSDNYPADLSASGPTLALGHQNGYATCSGTSMAAPHIAALAGIIRSINPRLSIDSVKGLIRLAGNRAGDSPKTTEYGFGMPNARVAVNSAVAQTPNKLTPLFALYSSTRADYFYTTVPQMATAAEYGTLEPRVLDANGQPYPAAQMRYAPLGGVMTISYYPRFPDQPTDIAAQPTAEAWLFTTPENPKSTSVALVPLYRLSWKCSSPVCPVGSKHIDTTYTADPQGVIEFQNVGYLLDGIEGYIYPKTLAQPAGTQRLMRKYNPTRDDHAIFPENRLAYMISQGYTQDSGSDWLGYVYPNLNGTVPTVQ